MAVDTHTKGIGAILVGVAFAATCAITSCSGTRYDANALRAENAAAPRLTKPANPNGWTVITNPAGETVCREHRRDGRLDDDGRTPAVIRYDPATGAVTGREHWRNGKRAEPPLPFAPQAAF